MVSFGFGVFSFSVFRLKISSRSRATNLKEKKVKKVLPKVCVVPCNCKKNFKTKFNKKDDKTIACPSRPFHEGPGPVVFMVPTINNNENFTSHIFFLALRVCVYMHFSFLFFLFIHL